MQSPGFARPRDFAGPDIQPAGCLRCRPSFSKRFCTHCHPSRFSGFASAAICRCSCAYTLEDAGAHQVGPFPATLCTRALASLMMSLRVWMP